MLVGLQFHAGLLDIGGTAPHRASAQFNISAEHSKSSGSQIASDAHQWNWAGAQSSACGHFSHPIAGLRQLSEHDRGTARPVGIDIRIMVLHYALSRLIPRIFHIDDLLLLESRGRRRDHVRYGQICPMTVWTDRTSWNYDWWAIALFYCLFFMLLRNSGPLERCERLWWKALACTCRFADIWIGCLDVIRAVYLAPTQQHPTTNRSQLSIATGTHFRYRLCFLCFFRSITGIASAAFDFGKFMKLKIRNYSILALLLCQPTSRNQSR